MAERSRSQSGINALLADVIADGAFCFGRLILNGRDWVGVELVCTNMNKLKPLVGLTLVVVTVLLGFSGVDQWIVLFVGILFTAAYIDSKWVVWKPLVQRRDGKFYRSLMVTYAVETVLAFALYWLGRGVASLL